MYQILFTVTMAQNILLNSVVIKGVGSGGAGLGGFRGRILPVDTKVV